MEGMKFKEFVWAENPEAFHIQATRTPEYTIDDEGSYNYKGLGPLCRVISGTGVFQGDFAYETFNSLQVFLASGTAGDLTHPIWGTIRAYLTELEMQSQSREGFVQYSFTFREADESGVIPILPSDIWPKG